MAIKNQEAKKKLFKNNVYAFLMDLYKVTYSSYTKVSLTKLQEKHDIVSSGNQWLLNKAIKEMGVIKQIGNTGNIKYYWSYAEMPNIKLANRIIEKINLYKINKDKTKDDLDKLKNKGLIPINKQKLDYVKIYEKTIKEASTKVEQTPSQIKVSVSKLLQHRYYNDVLEFVKFYKSNKLDMKLYDAIKKFNLPSVAGVVMRKYEIFDTVGFLMSDVTPFHIIALIQLYWKNKISNINSYKNIELVYENFTSEPIFFESTTIEPAKQIFTPKYESLEPAVDNSLDNAVNLIISHLDSKYTELMNKKVDLTQNLVSINVELKNINEELTKYTTNKDLINSLVHIL